MLMVTLAKSSAATHFQRWIHFRPLDHVFSPHSLAHFVAMASCFRFAYQPKRIAYRVTSNLVVSHRQHKTKTDQPTVRRVSR